MRHRSAGFSIVAAIFVLVILAGLGAFVITISEVQRQISITAAQGARAYQTANAGLEWGLHNTIGVGTGTCNSTPTNFTPPGAAFTGFNVAVTCTSTNFTEGAGTTTVFVITSTATFGTFTSTDYVTRTLQITATSP
jgi:MSHA biogenesis protein MshP